MSLIDSKFLDFLERNKSTYIFFSKEEYQRCTIVEDITKSNIMKIIALRSTTQQDLCSNCTITGIKTLANIKPLGGVMCTFCS